MSRSSRGDFFSCEMTTVIQIFNEILLQPTCEPLRYQKPVSQIIVSHVDGKIRSRYFGEEANFSDSAESLRKTELVSSSLTDKRTGGFDVLL